MKRKSNNMKVPQLTISLKTAYKEYLRATEKKQAIQKHLNPLLDALLLDMKISLADSNVGAARWQEPVKRLIIKQDDLYLADEVETDKYYRAAHKIYIENGYDVELFHCPILIARSEEVEVEHHFIDESMYLVSSTGLRREKLNNNLKARKEYIALTLDLVEKMINAKKA